MISSSGESRDASEICLTMQCLAKLGFTPWQRRYAGPELGYKLATVDLGAQEAVNRMFVPIVSISGVINTGRILGLINLELPTNLSRPEETAAFLVYGLQKDKNDLGPLPPWWAVGEASLHLHPVVQKRKAAQEKALAYAQRPHCVLIGDHAKLFRQELRATILKLKGSAQAWVTFDGQVLCVNIQGQEVQALAQGDSWPIAVEWPVSQCVKLPARFKHPEVHFGYFEGRLEFDQYRYPAEEVSGDRVR